MIIRALTAAAVLAIQPAMWHYPVPTARYVAVLRYRNEAALDKLLYLQQDRRSAEFFRFLTPARFDAYFSPDVGEKRAAAAWLQQNGATPLAYSSTSTDLPFAAPPGIVEQLKARVLPDFVVAIVDASAALLLDDASRTNFIAPEDAQFQSALAERSRRAAAEGLFLDTNAGFLGVLTWHNDAARTGQNTHETALTIHNVNAAHFGKLFARRVDGQVYAQPLYLRNVSIPGRGTYNVVYVATEHDSVYAFDASGRIAMPLWHASFIDPAHGIRTMPCTSDSQPECDVTILVPEHGITATPVIDPITNTLFVVAKTVERGVYKEKLHALDLAKGLERPNSPVTIAAAAPGRPQVRFSGLRGLSRAGLALVNGVIYIGYASSDDDRGWLIGYNAQTLAQSSVFCTTPTGDLGALWGSGAAPAVDANGNIFTMTGNGTFDANVGQPDYAMSMLRLTATGARLRVTDYFTPYNEAALSGQDLDLASGGVLLLPDQPGLHPHEVIGAFKTGQIFIADRDHLGGYHKHDNNQLVETVQGEPGGYWSSPAYFRGRLYLAGVDGHLDAYWVSNGVVSKTPVAASATIFNYPGATPQVSSNGSADGIVWAVEVSGDPSGGSPAVLHAYRADSVSVELYNSEADPARDRAGIGVKMALPTIADGRVFVPTQTELDVYGLLP